MSSRRSLGECVGVEAEAFGDCFGVAAGGTVGGHVHRETLGLTALLQLFFGCADRRGHGGLDPADLVHAALCLQVSGRLHFQALILTGADERAPSKRVFEPHTKPGWRWKIRGKAEVRDVEVAKGPC